jgi:acyl carrier protein
MPTQARGTTEIERDIRSFIVANFLFGQSLELGSDESLLGRGVIDSTGVLELVTYLEENYKIKVEDNEVVPENLDSINNVSAYVARKINHSV